MRAQNIDEIDYWIETYDSKASGVGKDISALVGPQDEVFSLDVAEGGPQLGRVPNGFLGEDVRQTSDPGQWVIVALKYRTVVLKS